MIATITTEQDAEQFIERSRELPVLIFKHSTRCPVSAHASQQFRVFSDETPEGVAECAQVLVVENRPVSQWLADRVAVRHASPQLILLHNGEAVWNASHYGITKSAMEDALHAFGIESGN